MTFSDGGVPLTLSQRFAELGWERDAQKSDLQTERTGVSSHFFSKGSLRCQVSDPGWWSPYAVSVTELCDNELQVPRDMPDLSSAFRLITPTGQVGTMATFSARGIR